MEPPGDFEYEDEEAATHFPDGIDDGLHVPVNEVTEYVTGGTEERNRHGILTPLSGSEEELIVTPRSYQLEMLEESLKKNIIVAVGLPLSVAGLRLTIVKMDTGSGKTQM